MFDVQLSAYISLHRVTSSTPKFVSASFLKHLPVVELHLGSFEAITLIFLFVELTSVNEKAKRCKLTHPSTCNKKFGPGMTYLRLFSLRLWRRSTPSGSEVWSLKSEVQSPFSAFIFLNLTSTSSRQQPQKASLKHWKIGLKWPEANKQGD